jgi:hypothetical protein
LSNLKGQISLLKAEFEKQNRAFETIELDNGEEIRFRNIELFNALDCIITGEYDHPIAKGIKNHEIVRYTGDGNFPQALKCLINSGKKYGYID